MGCTPPQFPIPIRPYVVTGGGWVWASFPAGPLGRDPLLLLHHGIAPQFIVEQRPPQPPPPPKRSKYDWKHYHPSYWSTGAVTIEHQSLFKFPSNFQQQTSLGHFSFCPWIVYIADRRCQLSLIGWWEYTQFSLWWWNLEMWIVRIIWSWIRTCAPGLEPGITCSRCPSHSSTIIILR